MNRLRQNNSSRIYDLFGYTCITQLFKTRGKACWLWRGLRAVVSARCCGPHCMAALRKGTTSHRLFSSGGTGRLFTSITAWESTEMRPDLYRKEQIDSWLQRAASQRKEVVAQTERRLQMGVRVFACLGDIAPAEV